MTWEEEMGMAKGKDRRYTRKGVFLQDVTSKAPERV